MPDVAPPLPAATVARMPAHWPVTADPGGWPWADLAPLPPLLLADGSGAAGVQTTVRLCHADAVLFAHFDCVDHDIWGTFTSRDDPIYDEEAVELFLAPGDEPPARYYEFEVSPRGVLLDALIHNPTGVRADLQADFAWNCPGIRWGAACDPARDRWSAWLAVPLAPLASDTVPSVWRANLYRIERPRNGPAEFSCWSPALTDPADFHKPNRFGTFILQKPIQ